MAGLRPFAWGTIYVGIFSISAALVLNAATTAATTVGDADGLFTLAAWLGAAAGASLVLSIAGEVLRGGWRFWQASQGSNVQG